MNAKAIPNTQKLVQISLIGALYTVLTLVSGPLAFGSPAGIISRRSSFNSSNTVRAAVIWPRCGGLKVPP